MVAAATAAGCSSCLVRLPAPQRVHRLNITRPTRTALFANETAGSGSGAEAPSASPVEAGGGSSRIR